MNELQQAVLQGYHEKSAAMSSTAKGAIGGGIAGGGLAAGGRYLFGDKDTDWKDVALSGGIGAAGGAGIGAGIGRVADTSDLQSRLGKSIKGFHGLLGSEKLFPDEVSSVQSIIEKLQEQRGGAKGFWDPSVIEDLLRKYNPETY